MERSPAADSRTRKSSYVLSATLTRRYRVAVLTRPKPRRCCEIKARVSDLEIGDLGRVSTATR
jgi:hypothetical protein